MDTKSFRFLDLPGEIRNRIYEIALCSFDPPPPYKSLGRGLIQIQSGRARELTSGICQAVHDIETAILRTSKQVHREAYDIMVKTNQFVHVRTIDISMSQLLIGSQVPIVTLDRAHSDQFQGYVLRVNMTAVPGGWVDFDESGDEIMADDDSDPDFHAPRAGQGPHFSFMILGRDWNMFCRMLSEADIYVESFSTNVKIVLTLNPWTAELPNYKAPITDLFTVKTQEALLQPFQTQIRGFIHVEVCGAVLSRLKDAVELEVKKSPWTDPLQVLKDLRGAKDLGAQYFAENKITETSEHWTTAVSDIRRMRSSVSWEALAIEGGPTFVQQLAELQFELLLSSAQNSLRVMKAAPNNKRAVMTVGDVVTFNLQEAADLPGDFARQGSSWRPSDAQTAKLYFTQAQCWRLMGEVEVLESAMEWIQEANEASPGNAEIEEETRAIAAWADRVDRELAEDPRYQQWMAELQAEAQAQAHA